MTLRRELRNTTATTPLGDDEPDNVALAAMSDAACELCDAATLPRRGASGLPPPRTEYLKLPELALLMRCSARTIQRLLETGEGPPVIRISERRMIFRVGDVIEWLEKRRCSRRAHNQL